MKEKEVAKQIAENIPPVITEQVPPTVSEQVPSTVSEQVPPAVSEQVLPEVSEQAPPPKENSIIDNELVQKITAENEKLKVKKHFRCFYYVLVQYAFCNS